MSPETRILWLPAADVESRAVFDYETNTFLGGPRNPAGVRIDSITALQSTVVLACVRALAESVAALPLHIYRRMKDGGKEIAREHPLYRILHVAPNGWQTSFEWREQQMLHLGTYGQSFSEVIRNSRDIVTELVPLHPSRMTVERIETGSLRYRYIEETGSMTAYSQDQIMHIRWLTDDGVNGIVPVELARDAIGLARACEIHGASFFGNGARPGVVLATENTLSVEAAESLRSNWERVHRGPDRASRTAVLTGGLKPVELGGTNQESQFLETRRFQIEEICRLYRVPPHLVGDLTRSSFGNIEQQSIDFVQHTLLPWLRRFESAFARDLLGEDTEHFIEFDARGLLRGDAAARASYYSTLYNLGVASINEIRSWENLNPISGGDTRFVQLNMQALDEANAKVKAASEDPPVQPAADVSGLTAVIQQITTGAVDDAAAQAMLKAVFPSMADEDAGKLLGGVKKPEPPPEPPAEEAGPQPTADVSGLLAILEQVGAGSVTPEAGLSIIQAVFPVMPLALAEAIVAGVKPPPEGGDKNAVGDAPEEPKDDPPETPNNETRAAPDGVKTGDFVSWSTRGSRARGRITKIVRDGEINVPGADFKVTGTPDNPAALIRLYREEDGKWKSTDTLVGHKLSSLTKISDLESRDAAPEPAEGQWVTLPDGEIGRIEHVMRDGVLNLGDLELPASPDAPAVLVSTWADGEFTGQVGLPLAEVTLSEPPSGYEESRVFCATGEGGGTDATCSPKDSSSGGLPDVSALTKVGSLGGSTGAALMEDSSGNKFVVKSGNSPGHIRAEAAANAVYEAAGVSVPKTKLDESDPAKPRQVSEYVDAKPLASLRGDAKAKAIAEIQKGFAADALLANWDVVGLAQDNILVPKSGAPMRVDNGGSMKYRAQGAPKDFGPTVSELDSLRTSSQGKPVFGSLTNSQVASQIKNLSGRRKKILDATPSPLRETMSKRLDYMENWANENGNDRAAEPPAESRVWCATGPGGGNDPTCSPKDTGKSYKVIAKTAIVSGGQYKITKLGKDYVGTATEVVHSKDGKKTKLTLKLDDGGKKSLVLMSKAKVQEKELAAAAQAASAGAGGYPAKAWKEYVAKLVAEKPQADAKASETAKKDQDPLARKVPDSTKGLPSGPPDGFPSAPMSSVDKNAEDKKTQAQQVLNSPTAKQAVKSYTSSAFLEMNDALRSPQGKKKGDVKGKDEPLSLGEAVSRFSNPAKAGKMVALSVATESAIHKDPITVYRGSGSTLAKMITEMPPGGTFLDRGFGSTSRSYGVASSGFGSGDPAVVMKIRSRWGLAVEGVTSVKGEYEYIQPRNMRYRESSPRQWRNVNGRRVLFVEVEALGPRQT